MLNLNLHTITKSCNKDGLAITTAFSKNIGYRFVWKEKQKEMHFDRTTINNKIPDCIFRLTSSDKTVYIKSKTELASFLELESINRKSYKTFFNELDKNPIINGWNIEYKVF